MTSWVTDLLDAAGAWLGQAEAVLPTSGGEGPALKAALGLLRERGGRLDAPLYVLLAGGTGAGKSTLLNALAGSEVARASAIRPTTDHLTVYHHARDELSVPDTLRQIGRTVRHTRPELLGKVLIDAPDFDSTALEHGARLGTALDTADLVLVLATPEKYANAALYRLLRAYRTGRAFRFILNRLDQGIPDEVRRDFREELGRAGFGDATVLALSARAALAEKLGATPGSAPTGDFARLERFLAEELDRVRAREIKRQNLDEGVGAALARLGALLPPELEERLARWKAEAGEIAAELGCGAADRVERAIREDRALREDLEAELALRHDGLLGVYQTVIWTLRRLRGSGSTRGLARRLALGGAGGPALPFAAAKVTGGAIAATSSAGADSRGETLPRELLLAAQRADDLGLELGLRRPGHALDAKTAVETGHRAHRAADAERASLLVAVREPPPPGLLHRVRSAGWNLAPTAVVVYTLGRWLWAFATGASLQAGWFTAGFLVTLIALFLTGRVVDALARHRAASLLRQLASAAAAAAAAEVTSPLARRVETHAAAVRALSADLDSLLARPRWWRPRSSARR